MEISHSRLPTLVPLVAATRSRPNFVGDDGRAADKAANQGASSEISRRLISANCWECKAPRSFQARSNASKKTRQESGSRSVERVSREPTLRKKELDETTVVRWFRCMHMHASPFVRCWKKSEAYQFDRYIYLQNLRHADTNGTNSATLIMTHRPPRIFMESVIYAHVIHL